MTVIARFLTASSSSLSTSRIVTCRDGIGPLKLLATRIFRFKGAFLVTDNHVFNHLVARYVCSLAPLTPLAHYAALRYARSWARSLCSLSRGTVEILLNMRSRCQRISQEQTRFSSSLHALSLCVANSRLSRVNYPPTELSPLCRVCNESGNVEAVDHTLN